MIGKTGRVTATVGLGLTGQVVLAMWGREQAFTAKPFSNETIEVGTRVVVVDHHGSDVLYVSTTGVPDPVRRTSRPRRSAARGHLRAVPSADSVVTDVCALGGSDQDQRSTLPTAA